MTYLLFVPEHFVSWRTGLGRVPYPDDVTKSHSAPRISRGKTNEWRLITATGNAGQHQFAVGRRKK